MNIPTTIMPRVYALLWHVDYGGAASEAAYADASTRENAVRRLRKWEAQRQCGSVTCECRNGMSLLDSVPLGPKGMVLSGAREVTDSSGETD